MQTSTFTNRHFFNPLVPDGPDPWLVWHEGLYYYTASGDREITVRKAPSLVDLWNAKPEVIWSDPTPSRCAEMWAPEFHLLETATGPRWYLYYCASNGWHLTHRCHVLESDGGTPLGPWTYRGMLQTDANDEHFAIDATPIQTNDGRLYAVWAGTPDHRLYISRLSDPWTTMGSRAQLEAEGFGCCEVREGPVTLRRNGRVFLLYSMCDVGKPDYRLGMLIADEAADLADPSSWTQHPEPVFARHDEAGVFGPGHNGFFRSPDGTEDWIIYHAKTTPLYTFRTRSPRVQRFLFRPDGTPDFGRPEGLHTPLLLPSGDPGGSLLPNWQEQTL